MSLEQELRENTAALIAHTAIMQQHNALLSGLAEKKGVTAATSTAPKTETKADTKAAKTDTKSAKTETAPTITHESIAARVGEFIGAVAKGSEDSKTRKDAIKRVLAHFEADKVSTLKAENLVEFDGMITSILAGEDPLSADTEEDDGVL